MTRATTTARTLCITLVAGMVGCGAPEDEGPADTEVVDSEAADTEPNTGDTDPPATETDDTTPPGETDTEDPVETDTEVTPAATCGDGVVDVGEACDDGNRVAVDGCTPGCDVTPGLVAWWPLDDGDDADPLPDILGGHDLTYVPGATPGTSGPSGSYGRDGSLHVYPGSTAHAVVEEDLARSLGGTVSAWVRPRTAISKKTATVYAQGADLFLGVTADDAFTFRSSTCSVESAIFSFTGDGWYHLAATWAVVGSQVQCTLVVWGGGQIVETVDDAATKSAYAPDFGDASYVGRSASAEDPRGFRGWIDQVVVFDHALTATEIGQLRQAQDGPHYD